MTEAPIFRPSPPLWDPLELHAKIRWWIAFTNDPPPPTAEEERAATEFLARLRATMKERFADVAADATPAAAMAPRPPEPPLTVRRVLDALERVALSMLADALTDPAIVAGGLRLLDGVADLRAHLGIERRAVVELGPTTEHVAQAVFDDVLCASMATPPPRWAKEIARALARSKAAGDVGAADAPSRRSPALPADDLARALNLVRGLEVSALEQLLGDSRDVGPAVLEGLAAGAHLRSTLGITRHQEDTLRRPTAPPARVDEDR